MTAPRICRIDAAALTGVGQVHDRLSADLGFPDYYGRNLDALWDVLTGDLEGPAMIEIEAAAAGRARLGPDFDRLLEVLKDAATENAALTVILL